MDGLLKAYHWETVKKDECWKFERMQHIGRWHSLLEGNWTPWVRIQEYPDRVDIRAKIYSTRDKAERPLIQMRQAANPELVFSMKYKSFYRLMSSLRRWYYTEKWDSGYEDEVTPYCDYNGTDNSGLLVHVNYTGILTVNSFFKTVGKIQRLHFSKEFCQQLAFPFCAFGYILSFENFTFLMWVL